MRLPDINVSREALAARFPRPRFVRCLCKMRNGDESLRGGHDRESHDGTGIGARGWEETVQSRVPRRKEREKKTADVTDATAVGG